VDDPWKCVVVVFWGLLIALVIWGIRKLTERYARPVVLPK